MRSALYLATACVLISACSSSSDRIQDPSGEDVVHPIPRFPAGGLPSTEVSSTGLPSKEQGPASTTGELDPASTQSTPDNQPSWTHTKLPTGQSSAAGTSDSAAPTSSSPEATDTTKDSTQPQPKSGEAVFVDWGLFNVSIEDSGEYYASKKRQTPAGEHQITRLGNDRIVTAGVGTGNIIRRTYGIFDVREVREATGATLEFYIFASSAKSNGAGGYTSPDASETVEIHSLDRFTPQEIIDAPFNQDQNHSLDVKIFEDLADGRLYGSFTISAETVSVDNISPGPTATPKRSDCHDVKERACGRWLRIPLSAKAVQDINLSDGLWAMGWSLASVTHAKSKSGGIYERLFFGAHMDTSPSHDKLLPDYIKPKPRLVFEYKTPDSNTTP